MIPWLNNSNLRFTRMVFACPSQSQRKPSRHHACARGTAVARARPPVRQAIVAEIERMRQLITMIPWTSCSELVREACICRDRLNSSAASLIVSQGGSFVGGSFIIDDVPLSIWQYRSWSSMRSSTRVYWSSDSCGGKFCFLILVHGMWRLGHS